MMDNILQLDEEMSLLKAAKLTLPKAKNGSGLNIWDRDICQQIAKVRNQRPWSSLQLSRKRNCISTSSPASVCVPQPRSVILRIVPALGQIVGIWSPGI